MKINIIIAYRPFSSSIDSNLMSSRSLLTGSTQLPDGRWNYIDGQYRYGSIRRPGGEEYEKDELVRAIKFLNNNSHFKRNITVVIDPDIYPYDNYLKEFDNVTILKSGKYKPGEKIKDIEFLNLGPLTNTSDIRYNIALAEGINSVPNDEWLCYAYRSDLICGKYWDRYIVEAIQKYGENCVYVPMFTEVRPNYNNIPLTGIEPTSQLIWEEWRKKMCCHALIMPMPSKGYFTEEDMDYYIKTANGAGKIEIIENPGDRIYGNWTTMVIKAKYAKKAFKIEQTFDLRFDDRLRDELHMKKVVVARSFVFHPYCPFKYSTIKEIIDNNKNKGDNITKEIIDNNKNKGDNIK